MNKENKLPTAYDMLKNQLFPSEQARSTIAGKIEEHTGLHTDPLREELERLRAENERLKTRLSNSTEAKIGLHKDFIRLNTELDRVMTDSNNKNLVIQKFREAFERIIIEKEDSEQVSCEDIIENMVQIAENTLKSENK